MTIEVGKKYRRVNYQVAVNLGLEGVVEIVRKEDNLFLGGDGYWYFSNGESRLRDPLAGFDTLDLGSEVID